MKNTNYTFENGKTVKTVTYIPEQTKADILRANLTIHLTNYDYAIRQKHARNPRVYHNPYALGLYFEAIDRVLASMTFEGMTVERALANNFTDHLLNYLRRNILSVRQNRKQA